MPPKILRQSERDAIFREADAPAHPDAQYRADMLRKLYDHAVHHNDPGVTGGPTLADEDLPSSGTMVSIPGAEQQYPTMPDSQDLKDYFEHHQFGPEDYPGGWEWPPANDPSHHDVPKFYLDESRNYADPWDAGQAALEGHQIGVYDLSGDWSEQGKPSTVLTNQFINDQIAKGGSRVGQSTHETRRGTGSPRSEVPQSGSRQAAGGGGVHPQYRRANRRSLAAQGVGSAHDSDAVFAGPSALTPDHDWSQHGLGDPDMWVIARLAAGFDPKGLVGTGGAGGSHGAKVFRNPTTNEEWVIKQPPPGQEFLAQLDVSANQIAQMSGVDTPDTFLSDGKLVGLKPGPISAQVKFPNSKDAFPGKKFDPEKLSDDDLLTIQKHHALDWLLSNHDSHPMGFIRLQDGKLAGIDKGQAYKYFGQDKLHWNFHPNQDYGETEPVYNTLYRNFAKGGRQILDPRQGELGAYVQHLQDLPDEDFIGALKPYAVAAAKQKALLHPWHHTGLIPGTVPPNDVDAFLKAAVARKHNLMHDFSDLYDRALAHRMTGSKIARSHMFPSASGTHAVDRAAGYPEDFGYGFPRQAALSNPENVGFGEPGIGAFYAHADQPVLDGFSDVIALRSQMKMAGMDADLPVAGVQDVHPFGDSAVEDAVGRPVRQHSAGLAVSRQSEVPVSPSTNGRGPVPAAFDGRFANHDPAERGFLRESGLAPEARSREWVTVAEPSGVMGVAPSPMGTGSETFGNRAGHSTRIAASQPTLPLDWNGHEPNPQPLYRGAVLDLRGPEADQVRRSLLGNSTESIYGPGEGRFAPCNGCPHPVEKIAPPKDGPGVQGALPLGRGFSDNALATTGKARWTQMGKDIIDLLGHGDDTEWSDDPKTAEKQAMTAKGSLQLPVVLAQTQRPDGDPTIDSVRIVHPGTGHWYEIMPGRFKEGRYAQTSIRLGYAPDPSTLVNMNKQMGSHGAQLWRDPQGEWLLKKPGKNQEFMIPLDVATSQLQAMAGLEGPEVHAIPMRHPKGGTYLVAAHRMYPNATQAWQKPPHLADVHPDDLLTLQKHQAMDWLIANHDPHVGNFMRTDKGLVGVDKGQALKYFGRDRLDWNFHPNYYAREPIYNNLWREYAGGMPGEMNDPREGDLGDFIANLQSIPDDKLKELFHPYATAAARVGLLATGDNDPQRGQTYPRVKANDPEAFLNALVSRKNHLADDLGEMYDRAAVHRAAASMNAMGGEPITPPVKQQPRQQQLWAPQYGPGKHELGRPAPKAPDYWTLPPDWDEED